ncbi:DUF6381 family protein [Streptomyces sp. NPDC015127]|uniref:DUF6381 family protein n=1 Tax=Streptomyces sp. NPDC015127 TaxID=3364939 RepID=UPI0036F55777
MNGEPGAWPSRCESKAREMKDRAERTSDTDDCKRLQDQARRLQDRARSRANRTWAARTPPHAGMCLPLHFDPRPAAAGVPEALFPAAGRSVCPCPRTAATPSTIRAGLTAPGGDHDKRSAAVPRHCSDRWSHARSAHSWPPARDTRWEEPAIV